MFDIVPEKVQVLIFGVPSADITGAVSLFLVVVAVVISLRALRETARANILNSLPIIVARYDDSHPRNDGKIFIQNMGMGTALNIRIDNFYNSIMNDAVSPTKTPNKPQHAILKFTPIDMLRSGKEVGLDTSSSKIDGIIDADILTYLIFNQGNKNILKFHIRYSDTSGTEYISRIDILDGGSKVAGAPKRYGLKRRITYGLFRLSELLKVWIVRFVINNKQRNFNKQYVTKKK
jgi:hypothetical protein